MFSGLQKPPSIRSSPSKGVDIVWVKRRTASAKSWDVLIPTIRAEELRNLDDAQADAGRRDLSAVHRYALPDTWVCEISWAIIRGSRACSGRAPEGQAPMLEDYEHIWEGNKPRTVAEGAITARIQAVTPSRVTPRSV